MNKLLIFFGLFAFSLGQMSLAAQPGAARQSVYFIEPADGASVTNPFTVRFGVAGMDVKPLGDMTPNTGHHHLIIDGSPVKQGEVVPMDDKNLHFGKGQTETQVTLPPGAHRLTMQSADGAHVSYGPAMAATINVLVK